MLRSRSTDMHRCSYENISSRLNRLRNRGPCDTPESALKAKNYLDQSASIHRPTLKIDENGIFALEGVNKIGKVAKNTGLRKYNQRVMKEALTKEPIKRN